MSWIFPLSLLILFEVIADIFSKEWSLRGGVWLFVFAIAGYIIGNIFWLIALRDGSGLGRGAILFSVASAILAAVIGMVYYREHMTSLQLVGAVLGIASITLLVWE